MVSEPALYYHTPPMHFPTANSADLLRTLRHHRLWMVVPGTLAVLFFALSSLGIGHARAGSDFVAEICTAHGLIQVTGNQNNPLKTPAHDCCQHCGGAKPVPVDMAIGVSPAPTFYGLNPHAPRPPRFRAAFDTHRPRGPPAA